MVHGSLGSKEFSVSFFGGVVWRVGGGGGGGGGGV